MANPLDHLPRHTFKHRSGQCVQLPYDPTRGEYFCQGAWLQLQHLGQLFGLQHIPVARFRDVRHRKIRWLPFDQGAQQVLYAGRWWDTQILWQQLGIRYAPVVQPLGGVKSPGFAKGVQSTQAFSNTKNERTRKKAR